MQLIDACADILYFTTVNREISFCQFEPQPLLQRYHDMISQAERQVRQAGISDSHWRSALFAIAVWVDEAILLSEWPHRGQWQKQSLQRTFFHTANGGEEFYTRLRAFDKADIEVLELYDVVMSLGFKGALFRSDDALTRREITENTMRVLSRNRDMSIPGTLFASAYGKGGDGEYRGRFNRALVRRTVALSLPPLICALVYFILYARLSAVARALIKLF
jgi:type VI secretion system protein ImpK